MVDALTVIVLAGGDSSRMDRVDKVLLPVGGVSLLDHVLDAWPADARLIVVGPHRPTRRPVTWCREEPPGSGPVAAVAAALPLVSTDLVAIVGGDMPLIAPAVPVLVDTARQSVSQGGHGAWLVSPDGRPQPLASCLSRTALSQVLPVDPTDAALLPVLRALDLVEVSGPAEWTLDADTIEDLDQINRIAGTLEGMSDD